LPLRVLVVSSHAPWPLDHGGRLRLYHFLRRICAEARVTLAVAHPPASVEALPAGLSIAVMAPDAAPAPARPSALEASFTLRRAASYFGVNRGVERWLARHGGPEDFDVALVAGPAMGLYVAALRVPVVWDAVDHMPLYALREGETGGPRAWLSTATSIAKLGLYERAVSGSAAITIYSSSVDASYARRWSRARIVTVSNGVDLGYFHDAGGSPDGRTIAFVGALAFPPNVDAVCTFARRVWPRLLERDSARRWLLVGRAPDERVRSLAHLPGVELAADVKDVRPYLTRAAVVIAPTRAGGGVKNKVIEGCAMNRLVVASRRAVAGLSARPGRDLLVAESADAWVRTVDGALRDESLRDRVRRAGHAWVRANHDWDVLGGRVLECLRSVARPRSRVSIGAAPAAANGAPAAQGLQTVDAAAGPARRRKRRQEVQPWR